VGLEGVTLVRCLPLLPTIKLVVGHSGGAKARQAGVALFAVQKTLASLEGIGLVDVERGPVENRYRLNTRHRLVAHGLRALFEGERHMPRVLARELGNLLKAKSWLARTGCHFRTPAIGSMWLD